MASRKGAGVGREIVNHRSATSSRVRTGVDESGTTSDIGKQVEEYLTSIKQELSANHNPRLKIEQSRLQDLLDSYRKLCQVYDSKKDSRENLVNTLKKDDKLSEIYSVLYPELYADKREAEKRNLRKSLIKSRTPSEACVPKNLRIQTARTQDLQDTRQKEKDRFVRLVSSAPSAFLQGPSQKRLNAKRFLLTTPTASKPLPKREDAREKEKERLAKILSSDLDANPTLRKRSTVTPSTNASQRRPALVTKSASSIKRDTTKNPIAPKTNRPKSNAESGMVKRDVGSLPKRIGSNTVADRQDRRKKLLDLNNREYQEYLDQLQNRVIPTADKAVLAREASLIDLTDESVQYTPRSMTSVATQTDDNTLLSVPMSPASPMNGEVFVERSNLFPVQKEAFITSPRAKLIKDLHGVSPCLPGASPLFTLPDQAVCDEKRKRTAYAEALKAQIDEKKRLEEEKRKKELEEDEYIEKKAKEQQERLKEEWEREQSLRQDWLLQKEAQEESVRQKMAELELEAKELKKKERMRRGGLGDRPISPVSAGHRVKLSPREVEQLLPQAMRDSMMSSLIAEKPRPKSLLLENNNNPVLTNENIERSDSDTVAGQLAEKQTAEEHGTIDNNVKDANRPTSPVLPTIQTDTLLRRSIYSSPRLELIQGETEKDELLRGDKILTQLGVFRRELELEQERLQQRLQEQAQT